MRKYPVRVFCYGTLMQGLANHHILNPVRSAPEFAMLYDYAMQYIEFPLRKGAVGRIPVIYPSKGGLVLGEIYEITNIEQVDRLESGYIREYSPELNAFFYSGEYDPDLEEAPNKYGYNDFREVLELP